VRLDPNKRLGGVPVLHVRDFLRRWGDSAFRREDLAARFGERTTGLLDALIQQALVEPEPAEEAWGDEVRYVRTALGGTFAKALGVPPVRREAAERALRDFIRRCREVNRDDNFVFKVERAIVFGSFLSDAEEVGDVDVALRTRPKIKYGAPDHWTAIVSKQVRAAKRRGRTFSSYFDELAYGSRSVELYVKNRSRIVQLTDDSDGALLTGPTRVVVEDLTT
jgi:hypothetical protein